MTATATKSKRETWRDWSYPAPLIERCDLLTRQELIAKLAAGGIAVEEKDFVYWQREGLLPYPVKIRRDNATRAYYPDWMADLVRKLLQLQADGVPLADVRTELKDMASATTLTRHLVADTLTRAENLRPLVEAIAREWERISPYRHDIVAVEVRLWHDNHSAIRLEFDTPKPGND